MYEKLNQKQQSIHATLTKKEPTVGPCFAPKMTTL